MYCFSLLSHAALLAWSSSSTLSAPGKVSSWHCAGSVAEQLRAGLLSGSSVPWSVCCGPYGDNRGSGSSLKFASRAQVAPTLQRKSFRWESEAGYGSPMGPCSHPLHLGRTPTRVTTPSGTTWTQLGCCATDGRPGLDKKEYRNWGPLLYSLTPRLP